MPDTLKLFTAVLKRCLQNVWFPYDLEEGKLEPPFKNSFSSAAQGNFTKFANFYASE